MSKQKQKGTAFETKVKNYFVEQGFDADRIALSGSRDQGDVVVRLHDKDLVLECKNYKASASRGQLLNWIEQAVVESAAYGLAHVGVEVDWALVVNKHNKPFVDSEVHTFSESNGTWVIQYLDEYVKGLRGAMPDFPF